MTLIWLICLIICLLGQPPLIQAQSVMIDWNPSWDSNFGAAAAPNRPPISSWLKKENGMLTRDGKEFIIFGAHLNGASTAIGAYPCSGNTACSDDSVREKTIRRIAASGFNTIRLQGMCSKDMAANSPGNYGCWTNATGTSVSEAFMVQLDKTIAQANQLGLQIWIGSFNYDQYATRAGYQIGIPGMAGMSWSREFRDQIVKPHILMFADRVNTQTGVKYQDNPGIIWQPFNEDGFSNSYFAHTGWFDQILNPGNYWKTELDAKIKAYYAAKGWALPGGQFPAKNIYDTWTANDKQHFVQFLSDTEVEYTADIYHWFKTLNPNLLVVSNTFNYQDSQTLNYTDISTRHIYSRVPSGDSITNPPNYVTRTSILKDPNGFGWAYAMGGSRLESTPFTVPEAGDYGLNRWDYERTPLEAIVHCLQKTSGFVVFNESQSLWQAKTTGIQYIHHHVAWPSRRLAAMLAAPIVEYRLIDPLPEKYVGIIDPTQLPAKQIQDGVLAVNPFRYQNGWDGSEFGYWLKRIYMEFGTPQSVTNYPKMLDATFAAGVQVTSQVFASSHGIIVNAPAVVGLVNDLKDITIGPMTLSEVTPQPNAIVMIRSDGNYPLFSGSAKLFVHQHSTVTDAAGFTGTVDGETVTSWGTETNTRLIVPSPFTITFNTHGTDLLVQGVFDDGTIVPLSTTYNPATQQVNFVTDTRFPLYLISPISTSPSPTSNPFDSDLDGDVDFVDFTSFLPTFTSIFDFNQLIRLL